MVGEIALGTGAQAVVGMGWVVEASVAGAVVTGGGWGLIAGGAILVGLTYHHYCE